MILNLSIIMIDHRAISRSRLNLKKEKNLYNIGQVSEITEISVYTLRFYDKEGLLPFIKRENNGTRKFSDEDIKIIRLISCLKNTGMKIKDIRKYIDLLMIGEDTSIERKEMLIEHRQVAVNQISKLKTELNLIDLKIKFYDNH